MLFPFNHFVDVHMFWRYAYTACKIYTVCLQAASKYLNSDWRERSTFQLLNVDVGHNLAHSRENHILYAANQYFLTNNSNYLFKVQFYLSLQIWISILVYLRTLIWVKYLCMKTYTAVCYKME